MLLVEMRITALEYWYLKIRVFLMVNSLIIMLGQPLKFRKWKGNIP
jgi:hypothetical protein